jgi:hypothetical protein
MCAMVGFPNVTSGQALSSRDRFCPSDAFPKEEKTQ